MSAVVPESPRLQMGSHQHPDDGMCLMEYVSMLAGQAFSDAPRCTDPLVAELARLVNDHIGEQARDSLVGIAPRLVTLPRAGRPGAPAIVLAALDVVLRERPDRRDLLRHRRRALRIATSGSPRASSIERIRAALYRRGSARHALACAVYVASEHLGPEADRDAVLAAMLERAVETAGGLVRV
ncbi:MAG TPA: hypothetical protein VL595_25800 [Pseudonocardia sp.]|jgi:hypothetical protein|nr:hypothetical protein [Pseudonocardia sp.]